MFTRRSSKRLRTAGGFVFAAAALAATATIATSGAAHAADRGSVGATGGTYAGCPYGAVCVYPGAGWNNNQPEHIYTKYGAHNLQGEYGVHRVFNNQYGGATARTCTGSNGSGCQGYLKQYTFIDKDLTPINSIALVP